MESFGLRRECKRHALISRWSEVWALNENNKFWSGGKLAEQRREHWTQGPGPRSRAKCMTLGECQFVQSAIFCVPGTILSDVTSQ